MPSLFVLHRYTYHITSTPNSHAKGPCWAMVVAMLSALRVNQATSQPTKQASKQAPTGKQQTSQPNQPKKQATHQPTHQSTNQSTKQTTQPTKQASKQRHTHTQPRVQSRFRLVELNYNMIASVLGFECLRICVAVQSPTGCGNLQMGGGCNAGCGNCGGNCGCMPGNVPQLIVWKNRIRLAKHTCCKCCHQECFWRLFVKVLLTMLVRHSSCQGCGSCSL